jgi:putative RNA 2'-phosphotransferase
MRMIKSCAEHGFFRGESCHCGASGRVVLDESRTEQLGRLVAGGLRHFPDELDLEMDAQGWVELDRLANAVNRRRRWANRGLLIALVQSDPKHRYEIRDGKIRARYGHSFPVELDHPENRLSKLFYGASEEEADRILEIGLKSASQRYVHLSTTPDKAWNVATFRTSNPKIIQADAEAAQIAGVKMMTVNDDIVISERIPPQYLSILPWKGVAKRD